MYAPDSRWGRTLFFDRGAKGTGTFLNANIFLIAASATNIFFVCPSFYKHFFLLAYNVFQFSQPLQTIYFQNCPPPPHLRQKNTTTSPSLRGERERRSCGPRIHVSHATVVCLVWETTHLHNGQLGNTRKLPLWIGGRYGEVAGRGWGGVK